MTDSSEADRILHFGLGRRLPVVHQSETSECGLACLAMVGSYFGHDLDLPGLRKRFPIGARGMRLSDLMRVAERLGLASRPLRLEVEQIGQLQAPAILHWDLDHFVVLHSVRRGRAVLHDPARGRVVHSPSTSPGSRWNSRAPVIFSQKSPPVACA
ncbi:MAG: hypothetical protein J4G09_14545 [Proteobacteria bacterium]|nr:hypothetical protein [Pseudomonadota bacterium]